MDIQDPESKKHVYSVWALPDQDVIPRLKNLMGGLRSEFGGPEFEPHVTAVGAISLTESEASHKFGNACQGLKAYNASVDKVESGTFFYQCVFLLLRATPEVIPIFLFLSCLFVIFCHVVMLLCCVKEIIFRFYECETEFWLDSGNELDIDIPLSCDTIS